MIRGRTIAAGLLIVGFLAGQARLASGQENSSVQQSVATAQAAIRQQHYSEAIHLLEDALKRFPSDTRLRVELGKAYVHDRQDARAMELFRAVLRDDPSNRAAKLELARVLSYRGKYEASNQLFRELLASDPADEAAAIGLVRNLIRQGKTDEARREVDQALARHPNSIRLQEYLDATEKKQFTGETRRQEVRPNRLQAETSYFSDSAGNRSWRAGQRLDSQISRGLTNSFRLEERSLWVSQGPKANVFSSTDELRVRLRRWLLLGGGGGMVRFAGGLNRGLYRGELILHPAKRLWLQGGFSRIPVSPTFQAAQFDLLAEGWWTRLDWQPRSWRISADFFKQHYSDSNRTQREDAEVLRWIGNSRFALGVGYRYTHASFSQTLLHGYFSPNQYHSHLGLGGFSFGVGKIFRGEYIARYGAESISQNPYQVAWEATARNRLLLGRWELGADYFYFHLAQSTGAFRAQTGRVSLAYRF
jgi:tetratricopeptide (TPR) repeat protein